MKRVELVVGWREWLRLPELGVNQIKAKVDTGARTSALHAENVRFVRRGGRRLVRFTIHPRQRSKRLAIEALAPLVGHPLVSNLRGGVGAMAAVQLDRDAIAADATLATRAAVAARDAGVITRALAGGGLQVSPPLTITPAQVQELVAGLRVGLDAL